MMKFISRLLICLFLFGSIPLSTAGSVYSGFAEAAQKKKKSSKKKKKKSKGKKKKSSKKKKKKSKGKKKKSSKKKKRKKTVSAEPVQSPPPVKKGPRINTAAYADELFILTGQLAASNKKMAKATRYLYQEKPHKKVVRLDSKPFLTTGDYEMDARNSPENIYLQRQLGLHYESISDWEGAKDVYLREVTKNPTNPDAHFYLGSFYATLGEYEKAKHSFEEALELDPDHKGTVDAMAMYTNTPDQRALSQDILGMSSERVPDGPAQKLTIIRQRISEGKFADALRLAEEGNQKFPTHHGFVQLIGETHLSLGNVEEAKASFQRAIKLNAREKAPHLSLANIYFNLGKYVYAALSFSDVIYLDPEDVESRYMQGLSYFKANEWGRAAAAWEDLLHYRPDHGLVRVLLPQTYYILAIEYNRLGNPTMGRQSFKNALSINSDTGLWLPGSMATLGKYYRGKRMYRESLAAYQEVLELSPNDADAYLGMGITYWNIDERQMARSSWEKSMAIQPDNNESRGWLILFQQES